MVNGEYATHSHNPSPTCVTSLRMPPLLKQTEASNSNGENKRLFKKQFKALHDFTNTN